MDEAFIGEVRAMPYDFLPTGWAPCDGRLLEVGANPALYSLLGSRYGGDGKTTFALPKIPPLKGKEGTLQYCIAIRGMFPRRA